ncbi:tandem-95 repeat protein [Ochrobactrum sp. C6C9]|uniref:Ig-like domain-containing protein n=1 Tax=Ochrobactrum sp. C6C9 TaxID=2736662 RepID=UPI00352FF2DE|nr:tandem-95 repeat protein [Ochrobactrum sp. C6C9]
MKAAVFPKAENGASQTFDGNRITLKAPSVVQMQIGPEDVARFERDGNDLVLVLDDGRILVIENFFVVTADGRNDLVFEDGNDVTWWAQYGDEWTGFDIAEIEESAAAPIPFLPLLAGAGLLAGGLAVAASGGGDDDSSSNIPPVALPETVMSPEDTPVRGNLLTNDTDPDGDPITVTGFEVSGNTYGPGETADIPGVGTITVNGDGSYVFTPVPDWNGNVPTVTYTVSDGKEGGTTTSTLDIEVTPGDDIVPDAVTTHAGDPVTTSVLANDDFENGDATITQVTPGAHGTVTINDDGTITYTPDDGYVGGDSYTYTVTSGGKEETTTVTVTVTNEPPEATGTIADQSNEDADGVASLDVSAFFSDEDDATLIYTAEGLPQGLEIDPLTGIISGTIDPSASQGGTTGVYSVTVTASDGNGGTVDQTFTWTVTNPAPIANDDAATTTEDTPVSGNVLGTGGSGDVADSDPDGDALSVTQFVIDGTTYAPGDQVVIAGAGTFTLGSDGVYNFTPAADWSGTVPTVSYTISDGEGGTDTADLVINVTPVNDTPTAEGTIGDQSDQDADGITPLDVTSFFSDIDSDTLTYDASGLPDGLTIDPQTGVISGTIDNSASQGGASGVHTVTVTATDGDGASVDQTFTWTVTNPIPTANDDSATTTEDTPVSGNVLTGGGAGDVADSDPDGDSLSVTQFTVDGQSHNAGDEATIDGVGTFTLRSDGAYTFTPDADWNGTVPNVTYTVTDGEGGTDTANLVITVTPVNDTPVIVEPNQFESVIEAGHLDDGTSVPGTPSASGSFTATDADGDTLTWSVLGAPNATYGEFSIDPATGDWTYILDNTLPATQALNEGDSVPLTYEVQVADGNGGTETRTVTITITGTNDRPVANADSGAVTEAGVENGGNTAVPGILESTGDVLVNDTDVDDGETATLTVSNVSFGGSTGAVGSALTGAYGSLLLNADGTYTYTLDNDDPDTQALAQGATVTEEFNYTTVDANGATSTSTLTITITGTNDQPEITSTSADATGDVTEQGTGNPGEDATTGGTLAASDVDDGASQTWSVATTNGTYGTIGIDPVTGEWTYTLDNSRPETQALNNGETRTETFTARVTDEHGAYSEEVITVIVNGSNDDVAGTGDATVPVTEDSDRTGTLQDYVTDVDDILTVSEFRIDVDGDGTDEVFGPGDTVPLQDALGNDIGTLTIEDNGDYSFSPAHNYSGEVPTITYVMAESGGGSSVEQQLTLEIAKISDAPGLQATKMVGTDEDEPATLDLVPPVITDTVTGTNDYLERLGAITLTIAGAGAAGATLMLNGTELTAVDGTVTIVLTDVPHINDVPAANPAAGVYHMTSAEYAAIQANPAAEDHRNFSVEVVATSYEVDANGDVLDGVPGRSSNQIVTVEVYAATDGADLATSQTELTFGEDSSIDLSDYLSATLTSTDANPGNDTDGSELYSYTISGLPAGTVVTINGTDYTANAAGTVTSAESNSFTATPNIVIRPPSDFSGDMDAVTVTLTTRDTDGDSTPTPLTDTSSVTLNLNVTPVAGDVTAGNVSGPEDTAIAFLARVAVTDTGSGSEVINSVSFEVPTGWTVTEPASSSGWTYELSGTTGTITFNSDPDTGTVLNEAARETILDAFTIRPPAHSSADETIALSIETTDSSTVDGAIVSDTQTVSRDVNVTVTPVAERTDTDSDGVGGNDVTMIGDHVYSASGFEDEWFNLATDGTFALAEGWSDADGDETLYAVLSR